MDRINGFSSSSSSSERQRLEKFYEDWIHHKSAKGKSWNKVWVVIRGHFMFAFKSRQTQKPDQLIGYLLLNYHTVCKNRGDDKPGKYKFDVHTIDRDGKMMHNRFRCETRPERDLWRGYIIGLATGRIPEDVPLTPSQLHAIASAMERLQANPMNRPSPPGSVPPPLSNGSNEFLDHQHINGTMMVSNGIHSLSAGSSGSSSGSGSRPSIPQIKQEFKHRFHEDQDNNGDVMPSWFFECINRDKAEQILEYGHSYGSVLMRESTTFRDSGSYTISMRNFPGSSAQFSHFQVMRVARGYKIQFDYEHEPLSCLSDIMAYFVSVSGTQPMRSNDVDLLISATAKAQNNGLSTMKNNNNNKNCPPRFPGNQTTNMTGGPMAMMNLSRKDSAMDIVNDAFQFLDNKSCISVSSNHANGRMQSVCNGCDGCGEDDPDDDCQYSVTGDDENGGRDDSMGDLVTMEHNQLNNSHGSSNFSNGSVGHMGTIQRQPALITHHSTKNMNSNCHYHHTNNNQVNKMMINSQARLPSHHQSTTFEDESGNGNGPFFQSELSARLNRRKESVESDDTRCPSSNYSSSGGGCNTNNIPLLSSTLQTRAVPPPPPMPTNAVFGAGMIEESETDELYVNSDDVIAQTLSRNHHNHHQQQSYSRQNQAPRLPPRPPNLTFESCSAELVEKLQRRLSRIPDA